MNIVGTLRPVVAVGALAAAAVLGACSGPFTTQATPEQPALAVGSTAALAHPVEVPLGLGLANPHVKTLEHWVYTAQFYHDDLKVYRQSGGQLTYVETLTGNLAQPQGTIATVNGWWYVANAGFANVLIYKSTKHGPKGPKGTLTDSGEVPVNVYVVPNRKLVAVSNASTSSGGPGSVSVYVDRATQPARYLTYGTDDIRGMGIAIDHHHNCYWSFNDPSTGSGTIVEFAGCRGNGSPIVPLTNAGGLAFDQAGNLYYIDQNVGVYRCRGITHCKVFATGFGDPVNLNFDHRQKTLWVADATGYIDAVDPKTGTVTQTPAQGGSSDPPFGVAAAPGGD